MGDLLKKTSGFNIANPAALHWGQGAFDRKKVTDFDAIAKRGKGMTAKDKADYRAREAAKKKATDGSIGVQTPLSDTYS
jgi:hypothetical protein